MCLGMYMHVNMAAISSGKWLRLVEKKKYIYIYIKSLSMVTRRIQTGESTIYSPWSIINLIIVIMRLLTKTTLFIISCN